MKKTILASLALSAALFASAQTEVLKLTMADGTEHTFSVADVREMTFETLAEPTMAEKFAGAYTGSQSLTVGGMWTYSTTITCTLTAEADGTLTASFPEYTLPGTQMGDLTLGALTITGLEYDEAQGGFYRNYGGQGLTQHFYSETNGTPGFNQDYPLNDPSSILIVADGENGIKITNPFKLGAMPFPLEAKFEGSK
mgnify:CR=1 FL=1